MTLLLWNFMPLLSRRSGGCRYDFDQLHTKNKGRIGGNDNLAARVLHIFSTIAKTRRDGEQALTALFHAVHAYLEARDEALGTEYECKGFIAVRCRAVEDGSIGKSAFIEDGNGVARLCFQAGAHLYVLTLHLICLLGGRGGYLVLGRCDRGTCGLKDKVTADGEYDNDRNPDKY